ncbi:MAG TPA: HupE/UreJ family protein [Steroidobacteraceae bacterium]|nr:HupE/UreJ family protein [Steroidobacteraceae bacterium]
MASALVIRSLAAAAVLLLLSGTTSLFAHEIRPAYLQIAENSEHRFDVLWKQPSVGTQLLRLVPQVSNGLLDAKPTEESVANSFVVRRWNNISVARDSFDGATVRIDGLEYTITDALISISFANGQDIQEILRPRSPALVVHLTGTGKMPVPAYLLLGIEHILTGFDHLSFVLGLLLLVRSRLTLIKTITAFTVAHSLTLAAAALGLVHVNPAVIEALVAFSIVFVALELVRAYRGQYGLTARIPWLIAFTFGLLHGFAFAGSLAQIGLPEHNIPESLLLFNVGVELGQLLFVGAVLLLIDLLRRIPRRLPPWTTWIPPYAIGGLASFWVIQRLHFLTH